MNNITMILTVTEKTPEIYNHTDFLQGFLDNGNQVMVFLSAAAEAIAGLRGDIVFYGVKDLTINAGLYNEAVLSIDKTINDILIISQDFSPEPGEKPFYDEMRECLYAYERHAAVCARNEKQPALNAAARRYLPPFYITPEVNEACILLKRSVINGIGFLSGEYSGIEYSLKDWCHYINEYGYNTVICSRAAGYAPLSEEHNQQDEERFNKRYDYYKVMNYGKNTFSTHPCLWFLDVLADGYYPKKKILFCYADMPCAHVGMSVYFIALLEEFVNQFGERYDVYALINQKADAYHRLSDKYRVYYQETIEGTFHLGFCITQPFVFNTALILAKHCVRIIYSIMDAIAFRSFYVYENREAMFYTLNTCARISDGIVTISDFAADEFFSFFAGNKRLLNIPTKRIYLTADYTPPENKQYEPPFSEYFLIIGDGHKRKAIDMTLGVISKTKHNYVVLSGYETARFSDTIHNYRSGSLPKDLLKCIYINCKAVIYPSLYEGFGLPVIEGLYSKKRVILFNSELNRELAENLYTRFSDYLYFFDSISQIPDIIDSIDFGAALPDADYSRAWSDVASETEQFIREILDIDADPDRLTDRWCRFCFM